MSGVKCLFLAVEKERRQSLFKLFYYPLTSRGFSIYLSSHGQNFLSRMSILTHRVHCGSGAGSKEGLGPERGGACAGGGARDRGARRSKEGGG